MKIFKKQKTKDFQQQQFAFIKIEEGNNTLTITLDRAAKKNALHPKMIHEIAYAFQYAHNNKNVWIVLIQAEGNVFCAGADLKAMSGFADDHNSSIPDPDEEVLIGDLFNKIYKPTIAKITGDVYAGGFFFLAGASIVIAQDDVKFGLPEVKRGLYPFQVMASLFRVMPARKVIDWCIRGYNLPVEEALQFGLITEMVSATEIDGTIQKVINDLKQNSPTAISKGLEAYDQIRPGQAEHKYLLKMFMETIGSKDGQEGLKAFREKRQPNWTGE